MEPSVKMERQNFLGDRVKGEPVVLSEVMPSDVECQQEEEDTLLAPNDHCLDANQSEERIDDQANVEPEGPPAPSTSGRQPMVNEDGDYDLREKLRQSNILLNQQRSELELLKKENHQLQSKFMALAKKYYDYKIIAEREVDNIEDEYLEEHRRRLKAESELRRLKQELEQSGIHSRSEDDRAQVIPVADAAARSPANESIPGPSRSSLPYRGSTSTFQEHLTRPPASSHHPQAGTLGRQTAGPSPASNVRCENAGAAPGPSQPIPQRRTEGVPGPNSRPVPVANRAPGVRSTIQVQTAGPSNSLPRQQSVIPPNAAGPSRSMNQISVGPSTNGVGRTLNLFHCNMCSRRFPSMSTLSKHKKGIHRVHDKRLAGIGCRGCAVIFKTRKEHSRHRIAFHGTKLGPKPHKRAQRTNGNADTTQRPSTSSSAATTVTSSSPSLGRGHRIRKRPMRFLIDDFEHPQSSTSNAAMRTQPTPNERAIPRRGFLHLESVAHKLIGPDPKQHSAKYQCSCGLVFRRRATFRVHLRFTKYGDIYNCYKCDQDFKCLSVLKIHLNKVHHQVYVKESYKCRICKERKLHTPYQIIEHRRIVHGIT